MSDPSSTPPADPASETPAAGDPDPGTDLGDAGQRALAKERADRKAAEKAAKAHEKTVTELQAKLDELTAASQTEAEKAIEQARKEAAEAAKGEVLGELHTERKTNALLKAANGKLTDPADAVVFLVDELDVDSNGQVDPKAAEKAVAELLERKPHLKAGGFNGSAHGGPQGGGFDPNSIAPGHSRLTAAYAASDNRK